MQTMRLSSIISITLLLGVACYGQQINLEDNVCGNFIVENEEMCDGTDLRGATCESYGLGTGTLACTAACTFDTSGCSNPGPICGDGMVDAGEVCDGQAFSGLDCTSFGFVGGNLLCTSSCTIDTSGCTNEITGHCGDGVQNPGEECDEQDFGGADCTNFGFRGGLLICTSNCHISTTQCNNNDPLCGNGIIEVGEECDDGNFSGCDGCTPACVAERCGNGILDCGEQCDDGNTDEGDGCNAICLPEICGNGYIDIGEQCDDGNTGSGDGCSSTCTVEACGNGVVDAGEQCDDGNTISHDGCSVNCIVEYLQWTDLNITLPYNTTYSVAAAAWDDNLQKVVVLAINDLVLDMWTFDTQWTKLSPNTFLPARRSPALSFDYNMGLLVMVNGSINGQNTGETWVFDGTDWNLWDSNPSFIVNYRTIASVGGTVVVRSSPDWTLYRFNVGGSLLWNPWLSYSSTSLQFGFLYTDRVLDVIWTIDLLTNDVYTIDAAGNTANVFVSPFVIGNNVRQFVGYTHIHSTFMIDQSRTMWMYDHNSCATQYGCFLEYQPGVLVQKRPIGTTGFFIDDPIRNWVVHIYETGVEVFRYDEP